MRLGLDGIWHHRAPHRSRLIDFTRWPLLPHHHSERSITLLRIMVLVAGSRPPLSCLPGVASVHTTPVMCRPDTRQATRVHAEVTAGPLPEDLSSLVPIVGGSIFSLMFPFCCHRVLSKFK